MTYDERDKQTKKELAMGIRELISNVNPSDLRLADNYVHYKGHKGPTRLKLLMTDHIGTNLSLAVSYKNRDFEFYPSIQESYLDPNSKAYKIALEQKKNDDAKSLLKKTIEWAVDVYIYENRCMSLIISIPQKDFVYNPNYNTFEATVNMRSALRKKNDYAVSIELEDVEIFFDEAYEGPKNTRAQVFELARSLFKPATRKLSVTDFYPQSASQFKVSLTKFAFSLMNADESFIANLEYDIDLERFDYAEPIGNSQQEIYETQLWGSEIKKTKFFARLRNNILSMIQAMEPGHLKDACKVAFTVIFEPDEIEGVLNSLRAEHNRRTKLPNKLTIMTGDEAEEKRKIKYGELVIPKIFSFKDPDHIWSEGRWYFDNCCPFECQIIPQKSWDSKTVSLYLHAQAEGKSDYVFHVKKSLYREAIFYIWAYFGSHMIENKRQYNLLRNYFRTEGIGSMSKL